MYSSPSLAEVLPLIQSMMEQTLHETKTHFDKVT